MKTKSPFTGKNAEAQRTQSAAEKGMNRFLCVSPHSLRLCVKPLLAALLLGAWALMPLGLGAATNDLSGLLQKGLFEEEANRNLEAAAQAYQTVSAQFDKDRKLAATAIFRLGEIYRKQNKTNEAVGQYERIVREFSDQDTLVTLSRQNLSGIGKPSSAANELTSGIGSNPATAEKFDQLQSQYTLLKAQLVQARKETNALVIAKLLSDEDLRATIQAEKQVIRSPESLREVIDEATQRAFDFGETRLRVLESAIQQIGPGQLRQSDDLPTDDEEKEIRRIQAMIQNSPDLINAGRTPPILSAVSSGYLKVVRFLLDHGADVNIQPQGKTPLHVAAEHGQKAMAELLLSRGAGVNARNQDNWRTPLHEAAEAGFQAVAEVLIASKADLNARDRDGNMPLHLAAKRNRGNVVALLTAKGADVNAENAKGITALSFAAAYGNMATVKALLDAKADANAGKMDVPLMSAITFGKDAAVVELLLRQAGANPNYTGVATYAGNANPSGELGVNSAMSTPLRRAVGRGDAEIVKLLLQFKADPNEKSPTTISVLFDTIRNTNVLRTLLEAGADANVKNRNDDSALIVAVKDGNSTAVELLLARGANVNARGDYEMTPLHWAAVYGYVKPLELLLANRADLQAKDKGGSTPLHLAVRDGPKEGAELLLSHGADPNIRNNAGETPLDLTKPQQPRIGIPPRPGESPRVEQKELADLLRQHGALDDLPDSNSIRVTHAGWTPVVVFLKDTNSVNQFTLMEVVLNFYGNPQVRSGLLFPDFSKIIIHRPIAGKPGAKQEITVNLLTVTNSFDCAKDTWLKFGDVVEIPEREHTLAEPAFELTDNQRAQLNHCLRGKVTFVVRGQKAELELDGTANTCRLQLALGRVQNLLRSSSELSHIKINRTDPATGKTSEILADSKLTQQDNVWLRDGDVIEVPDKP